MWCAIAAILGTTMLPKLHVQGTRLVDPQGKTVILRGCNLGNWFVIEHWMWGYDPPPGSSTDQYELEALLTKRFGLATKDRLMELHRSSWITDRDFEHIRSFRFNCVRLPLNYRQFEDDAKPLQLRKDAFHWSDKAVQMAKKHGLYVILDMHGAQGGQSPYDHTGHSGQNKLWSNPTNSKRLAWLWGELAKRYRNETAVVAYDVFNEPYGGEPDQIRKVWEQAYHAIRKNDPDKLVWAHGRYDTYGMYGVPKENGWKNVGFQMHYYPGIFGNGMPTIRTHVKHLRRIREEVGPDIKRIGVPFLVGEMNVLFRSAGGAEMMRQTYDTHESMGWNTTMWSYKALSTEGGIVGDAIWGMVTNRDAIQPVNFATASLAEIETMFRSGRTMVYAVNEPLRKVLAPKGVKLKPLPTFPARKTAPQTEIPGWTQSDIGGPTKGGLKIEGSRLWLYGGGEDIWNNQDQFRYLHQSKKGDFTLSVRVESLEDLGNYCKAGIMVRKSLDPASEHLMISAFPNGDVQIAQRTTPGGQTEGKDGVMGRALPITIRLQRRGRTLKTSYHDGVRDAWIPMGDFEVAWLGTEALVGIVALSHEKTELVEAGFSNLQWSD